MKNVFVIIAKSSSGKDTAYKYLMGIKEFNFKSIVLYYSRPMRVGEKDGETYRFLTNNEINTLIDTGSVITSNGNKYAGKVIATDWYPIAGSSGVTIAMLDDEQFDSDSDNYLCVVSFIFYKKMREFFKGNSEYRLIPIYIDVPLATRLERYYNREKQQDNPNYEEIIRRAIADEKDFADVYAYIDKDDVIYNEGTQEEFFEELYKIVSERLTCNSI